jgi:hypothetical protein
VWLFGKGSSFMANMSNLSSSFTFIIYINSNTSSRTSFGAQHLLNQPNNCVGLRWFFGIFGDFDKKLHTALSVSQFLPIRNSYSVKHKKPFLAVFCPKRIQLFPFSAQTSIAGARCYKISYAKRISSLVRA